MEGDSANAARLIRDALTDLERRRFIRIDRTQHNDPAVFLLDERGTGAPYVPPRSTTSDDEDQAGYFRIPEIFWTEGWCSILSAPAISMYLIALYGTQNEPFWFSANAFEERYGLSESTRKKGLRELVDAGILTDELKSRDLSGETFGRTRYRKQYTLVPLFRSHPTASGQ